MHTLKIKIEPHT